MEAKVSKRTVTTTVRRLREDGKTVAAWAAENGFPLRAVRAVISGHNKGHYGQARRIALALGINRDANAD
jgi:gp16 family phage-associated protein